MVISHKKIKEINDKINEILGESEKKEVLFDSIKEILNYDKNHKFTYNKDYYENSYKKYYEKNKIKINTQKSENSKKKYQQKKLEKEKLIKDI